MVSVHRDFIDFSDFISGFRAMCTARIKDMDSLLVSLKGKMPKLFSFRTVEIFESL